MTRGGLFDPLLGGDRVAARLDDAAWVAALLAVEVGLAHAAAECGVVPAADAAAVERAAAGLRVDPAELGRAAVEGGNPVIPLVRLLRAAAGDAAGAVHPGATSQDVLDTALVLLARWAGEIALDDLRGAADAAAVLAAAHRDTAMIARTLGQQAVPTSFGLVAAGWSAGLDRAADRLAALDDGIHRRIESVWSELRRLPTSAEPRSWLHGDLHPLNILVDGGSVSGVVDFGDMAAGDRATDLSLAWLVLPAPVRSRFRRAAGARRPVDDATWGRARAWAIALSVAYLSGDDVIARIGARALVDALADAS